MAPMSAPAANAFALPVITIAPIAVVGIECSERRAELVHQRIVQRIELLRPVERDEADAAARLDEDVFVRCHERTPNGAKAQYFIVATARSSSAVAVPNPKNSRYAGICSNSMSVPTWVGSRPRGPLRATA